MILNPLHPVWREVRFVLAHTVFLTSTQEVHPVIGCRVIVVLGERDLYTLLSIPSP